MPFDWDTFTYDEAWLRQAVQAEVALACDLQVGGNPATARSIAWPQLQPQLDQIKILSLLFDELRALLRQANLGAGAEAALIKGRLLIQRQLSQLSSEQRAYFDALMLEETSASQDRPLRSQLPTVLCQMLSPADWQEIAQAAMASIQAQILQQVSLQTSVARSASEALNSGFASD